MFNLQDANQSLKTKINTIKTSLEEMEAQQLELQEHEAGLQEQLQHLEVVKGTQDQEIKELKAVIEQKDMNVSKGSQIHLSCVQ